MRKPAHPHVLFYEKLMRNKLSHSSGLSYLPATKICNLTKRRVAYASRAHRFTLRTHTLDSYCGFFLSAMFYVHEVHGEAFAI